MAVRNRALVLATGGLLSGSAIGIATDGLLQVDAGVAVANAQHRHTAGQITLALQGMLATADSQHRATSGAVTLSPVVAQPVLPVTAATGGGTNYSTRWFDEEPEPQHYRFAGFGVLVLESRTRWQLRESLELPPYLDFYDAEVELHIEGEAAASFWDQGADDEDVEILLMAYLQLEDAPYVWPDEKYS